MPALPKPHRVAFLAPQLAIDGADGAFERDAAMLLWLACIETCQRHPRLAVLDADATPLTPRNGHFAPLHAGPGGRPDDAFFAPTRRDELLWLEIVIGRTVVLHAIARDEHREKFEAIGRNVGESIDRALSAWLSARKLGGLPRNFPPIAADELVAVARAISPTLADAAREWTPVARDTSRPRDDDSGAELDPPPVSDELAVAEDDVLDEASASSTFVNAVLMTDAHAGPARGTSVRPLANRLPPPLRAVALRALELALGEDLSDLILAVDPDHPQALLARGPIERPLLRRAIAAAPGWSRPYERLAADRDDAPDAPTALARVAANGIALLCRPSRLAALDAAATALADDGRVDAALRVAARAVELHDDDARAHLALLELHRRSGRVGAWLRASLRTASRHGCPMDPALPWYPDQIHVDLRASTALLNAGRLDEAIALRANRLEGRDATWPAQTRALAAWRKDPRFVAWCYAREGYFRGDDARAVEGFGRVEPDDSIDLAILLDALVALGRADHAPLAWAHFGLGRGFDAAPARLAAARALMIAGSWRRGVEELWRVELGEPERDELAAIARCGIVMAAAPIGELEAALGDRLAAGAISLARRMARDVADFVPAAAKSAVVARALGPQTVVAFDPRWLDGFAPDTRSRRALDALFGELGPFRTKPPSGFDLSDERARGDRLVDRWLEVAFAEASEDDPVALVQAAAYAAAQALARYLAATTAAPTTIAGALRTVAAEALALVRAHRDALADRDARALLGAIEPVLRRAERWVGTSWLAVIERAAGIDERAGGDVVGFARELPACAARLLGPEEVAVLAWSTASLHRDRPDGWAARVAAQAMRLAHQTGRAGCDEWADAIAAQLAGRELEVDDAIDLLHVACYLAEGRSAVPCAHLARVLLGAGRGPAALAVASAGMRAASPRFRDEQVAALAKSWSANVDVPIEFERVAAGTFEALQKGDPARAEKLARWAVALDPGNAEAHRNLGLALAQQGNVDDALHHLVRATREQATQILSGVLYQSRKLPQAMTVLEYASRWYVRADQWLTYGGIAYAAMDDKRTVAAYRLAYELDPRAFDASQLNAYAGVLDEVGDHATLETIAAQLERVAGDDVMWKTNAWNHKACACIGLGRFDDAIALAERAVRDNPLPDNAAPFAQTLERARARVAPTPRDTTDATAQRPAIYALLERGDLAGAAAQLDDASWTTRAAALAASRFRFGSENQIAVAPRARAAAATILAATSGTMDRDARVARALALRIRDDAFFARDPPPPLGDRMTRDAFYREFRARGGIVLGEAAPPPPPFKDRVVVDGGKVARVSDYVALLRDLAALAPRDALAQFDLDDAGYLDVARAWGKALDDDPTLASTIAAGLAKR